ncbi:MAG: CinA family protein [Phascolarctobacterium sp.]|nr:CinA family protein [Phascolarctobacterium sp.]
MENFEELRNDVVEHLIKNNITISCMESCTSGLVASFITDTAGASAIIFGSLVTYANATKIQVGVDAKIIEKFGVYSKETACEMARVAQKIYNTDLAVGVTGTTGNLDPNNLDSISGEVHYAIFYKSNLQAFTFKADVIKLTRREIKILYAQEIFKSLHALLNL